LKNPFATIQLSIQEVDPIDFVSDEVRDDSGALTGKLTAESYDKLQDDVRGKRQFIVTAMSPNMPDKVHQVMSTACYDDNRNEALYVALSHVAHSIAVNFIKSQPPAPSLIING
tara:strand:+ start:304 stop:645 length:342 start_codon:yes stop_codon:yes gene_type:complete